MPSSDSAARRRAVAAVRGTGFTVAVALGAVAIWLIVTSTSQKRIEIGILAGLWGLLLGSYVVFGGRSAQREPGHDVPGELAGELSELRTEVAALRNELVEKVGGQLRLERIETTRLIGSDLEALQHELRRLRRVADGVVDGPETIGIGGTVETVGIGGTVGTAQPGEETVPEVLAEVVAAPEPSVQSRAADPLASMPRLTPFTDFALDPTPSQPPAARGASLPHPGRHATDDDPTAPGRRHRRDDSDNDVLARILEREHH